MTFWHKCSLFPKTDTTVHGSTSHISRGPETEVPDCFMVPVTEFVLNNREPSVFKPLIATQL